MDPFQHTTIPFGSDGTNLSAPVDRMPPRKHRLLLNARSYGKDYVQGRQGITQESVTQPQAAPVHSIASMADPIPSPTSSPGSFNQFTRVMGIGTNLWQAVATPPASTPVAFISPVNQGADPGSFSGRPMTFVTASSQFSPRPYLFIGDSNTLAKTNSANQLSQWGVAPPNFAPTIALGSADPNGPDIGATNVPYVYMFRARCDTDFNTGAVSNWGPPVRTANGLSPSSVTGSPVPTDIVVTLPQAHPDPQVQYIDVARYGGSLTSWIIIGSMPNIMGSTMTDTNNDLAIAGNIAAVFDDNQPFVSNDVTISGTCDILSAGPGLGGTITITGGANLRPYPSWPSSTDNPYYVAGDTINVAGLGLTFYRSPDTATTVEILEDCTTGTGLSFTMNTPQMANVHLPSVWGPFGGGLTGSFVFACGDPFNPGALYWTKGNSPESHPGNNSLFITSASEPLMNGALYSGTPYVYSNQRQFALYPNFGGTSDFLALEVPNSKGLYGRWAICVTPWGIATVSKSGVFLSAGGTQVSLTDEELSKVFPREGAGNDPSQYPPIDGLEDFDIRWFAPDMRQSDSFRLIYGDGFLYFTYIDLSGGYRTWVGEFDEATGKFIGWYLDSYTPACPVQYYEVLHDDALQFYTNRKVLYGTIDGRLGSAGGGSDFGNIISGHIRTSAVDAGDARPRKFWGDGEIDYDTQCEGAVLRWGFDNFTYFSQTSVSPLNQHGRRREIMDINAGKGQYAFNIGLDFFWNVQGGQIQLYSWSPSWQAEPELSSLRVTTWDDCGYPGAKFIQGFKLRADTLNMARSVQVLDDQEVSHTFTPSVVQHNGEQTIAYSFDTPFISHLVRFWPQDASFWRIQGIEWIFSVAPEMVTTWQTQQMTHGINGWGTHRDAYIALISSAPVTFTVNAIGNPLSPFTYTLSPSAGIYDKRYLSLQAMKARAWDYTLTSPSGFRLFSLDTEVRVKEWGSTGKFLSVQPFGDLSHTPAPARI